MHKLLTVCKDGEFGFATAAEGVRTPACRALLTAYAEQRRRFGFEIEGEIRRLGGHVEGRGSFAGLLHRQWMDLIAKVFERRDARTLLAECERGEEIALRAYDQALRTAFDSKLRAIIARQRTLVAEVRDSLRSLRTES